MTDVLVIVGAVLVALLFVTGAALLERRRSADRCSGHRGGGFSSLMKEE